MKETKESGHVSLKNEDQKSKNPSILDSIYNNKSTADNAYDRYFGEFLPGFTNKKDANEEMLNSSEKESNKEPYDGSELFGSARVCFQGVPQSVLNGIRVIPEEAASNNDLQLAVNGRWYEADGLWIEGKREWFKIPDINTVIVTYDHKLQSLKFNIQTNMWGSLLFHFKMTSPDFVPDSGGTTHVTDYPF